MLTDKQKDFLDGLEAPEWVGQWMAERMVAGDERVPLRHKAGRRQRMTFEGKDIESAIRYLNPRLIDWLDSRHLLKRQ